jgi:hypothetical protein
MEHLLPELKRVKNYRDVDNNNYYLISGGGYPSIYNHLKNAIKEVNSIQKYDYLILCLDADESTVNERIQQINNFIEKEGLKLRSTGFKIIVQNRCLETWFLGNRVVYPRQPKRKTFREYSKFYNVSIDDPELMKLYIGFKSISFFHYSYLKEMLLERHIKYTKNTPRAVTEPQYINQLIARVEDTEHLQSLKDFFDFCNSIR